MKNDPKVKKLTTTALMAAIIFVVTYLIRIPMPIASGGYINIGDAPVYVASALLGGPAGMIAAAIGSSLADLSSGFAQYMLPTAIVKGLMGYVCGRLMAKETFSRFMIASIIGGMIMVVGYAAFDVALLSINQTAVNYSLAVAAIPFNMIQWAAGVAVAAAVYPVVPRIKRSLL
jgi:uncharacterized membrane protein